MNRRWEVSEEILGTLVLDSFSCNSISINAALTQIQYTWTLPDWGFILSNCDNPGDKWHCTHEFFPDYAGSPPFTDQTALATVFSRGHQPYLIYSNLSGPSFDTTSGNTSLINVAAYNDIALGYTSTSISIMGNRIGQPRSFIISNPTTITNVRIVFGSTGTNLWTGAAGVQGTDYFTAGKHIFTFRKLKSYI